MSLTTANINPTPKPIAKELPNTPIALWRGCCCCAPAAATMSRPSGPGSGSPTAVVSSAVCWVAPVRRVGQKGCSLQYALQLLQRTAAPSSSAALMISTPTPPPAFNRRSTPTRLLVPEVFVASLVHDRHPRVWLGRAHRRGHVCAHAATRHDNRRVCWRGTLGTVQHGTTRTRARAHAHMHTRTHLWWRSTSRCRRWSCRLHAATGRGWPRAAAAPPP